MGTYNILCMYIYLKNLRIYDHNVYLYSPYYIIRLARGVMQEPRLKCVFNPIYNNLKTVVL